MSVQIDMGVDAAGKAVGMDLEELLATRLLVQGNSGSGKSHLLRRMLEGSAGLVQQVVIDPEGDFVTLSAFGHTAIEATDYSLTEIARLATRIREHRASVVLSLEGLEMDQQMRCAAAFLNALFDAHRDHWYPALVVVDEAQVFAPSAAGEVSDEARRLSLGAMTNLMCRGRKRGLAGVIATQRLAKLAKNVAAEASNFLMGRTFLDIDMARASDLLGMERKQAEQIRDLQRGHFLALGPALSRRPVSVKIGDVKTAARSGSPKLVPLPQTNGEDMQSLLFAPAEEAPPPPPAPPRPSPVAAEELIRSLSHPVMTPATPQPAAPAMDPDERDRVIETVLREIVGDPAAAFQSAAILFQDFLLRCRMHRLNDPGLDLAAFRRRLGMARAGLYREGEEGWDEAMEIAVGLPEDMLGVFLTIARAAKDEEECPADSDLAAIYGTSSANRARRLLNYMEERGTIVVRIDLTGKRQISIPQLGWTTAASAAEADPAKAKRAAPRSGLLL
ncbi:ATP-binding protein [Sphingomonas sp. LY54]|uniref:ATP-binding protein n=1 Tax=Sphingomonas sp. LY54 TaxID=3095343 RepID=UPI002D7750F6|nr:ATP-binding protein [Sphingomonas sp. LY54]WRP29433.1 ATP-binding protein [Sphingomonas sp. LY54]